MTLFNKFCTYCGGSLVPIADVKLEYICNRCHGTKRYVSTDPSDTLIFQATMGDPTIDPGKGIFIGNAVEDRTVAFVKRECSACKTKVMKLIRIKDRRPIYICPMCRFVGGRTSDEAAVEQAEAKQYGPAETESAKPAVRFQTSAVSSSMVRDT